MTWLSPSATTVSLGCRRSGSAQPCRAGRPHGKQRVKEHFGLGCPSARRAAASHHCGASRPDGRKVERDSDRPGPRRAQRLGSQPVPRVAGGGWGQRVLHPGGRPGHARRARSPCHDGAPGSFQGDATSVTESAQRSGDAPGRRYSAKRLGPMCASLSFSRPPSSRDLRGRSLVCRVVSAGTMSRC